jgi:hypothetical protein
MIQAATAPSVSCISVWVMPRAEAMATVSAALRQEHSETIYTGLLVF